MRKIKSTLFLTIALVGVMCFAMPALATIITFELDHEFSGATAPEGSAPWLTATFNDGGTAGTVTLTLEATNLTDHEFVSEWDFNFDPNADLASLAISQTLNTSDLATINKGTDSFQADGDGKYDIQFLFPTLGSGDRFGVGDSAVFDLTLSGITADSFDYLSMPAGGHGPFKSAAHVQGIGANDSDSGWIAPNPVPEPATMLLLGTGLVGLAGMGRKKLFKK